MNRRDFLKSALSLAILAPTARFAAQADETTPATTKSDPAAKVVRRRYKNTDLTVPLIGFGTMRLPVNGAKRAINYAEGEKLIARAMEAGINYFDTAWFYHEGESENFLGTALSKYPRESYCLADKMPVSRCKSAADAEEIFQKQLTKTKAGYFDFYLVHALNKKGWEKTLKFKIIDFLLNMQKSGKIRKLGFSFHDSPDLLRKIAHYHAWDFALIQLNYIDWTAYRSKEQYEILTERGIPIMIMEPLKGGSLANPPPATRKILENAAPDASPASWAFRYCGTLPNVLCILSGMTKMEHLQENIKIFTDFKPLSEFEQKTLQTAITAGKNADLIPCTACRYCMPCPADVEIPAIFSLWNKLKTDKNESAFLKDYKALPEDSRASACVNCQKCVKQCPQKIAIPDLMKKIAKQYPG